MREINVVDGQTVFTDTNAERIDELLEQLTKSVQKNCKHPNPVAHSVGHTSDTHEWYKVLHCDICGHEWQEWGE